MNWFIAFSPLLFLVAFYAPRPSNARTFEFWPRAAASKEKYAVMLDAGSSSSKLKVYKVSAGAHSPLDVSDITEIPIEKPDKFQPGLSTFADNIKGIAEYLKPIIEAAKKVVPENKRASTSVKVFATAGMRLLPEYNIAKILAEVDKLFLKKDFSPFAYRHGDAKVITGQDEAEYDWVTVNFLKGVFSAKPGFKTYGALDMGGASHQNAFEVKNRKSKLPVSTLDIGGKSYRIFAHSYLNYGEAEARKTYLERLVRRKRPSKVVYSPCHNNGFTKSVTVDSKEYIIKGSYRNARNCQKLLKSCFFCPKCQFKDQPRLLGEFYSFSLFTYAFQATGVVKGKGDHIISLKTIGKVGQSFCSKSSRELDKKKDYLADARCFHLNYIKVLLQAGYRVNTKRFVLHNADQLHGFELNWTLGALLMSNKWI